MKDRYGNKVNTWELIMGMGMSLAAVLIVIFVGNLMLLTHDFTRPLPKNVPAVASHKTVNPVQTAQDDHRDTLDETRLIYLKKTYKPVKDILTDDQIHAIAMSQIKK